MPQNPKREKGKTDGTPQQFRGLKSQHEFWQKHQFSYYETIGYDVKAIFAFLHTGYLTIYLSFWFVSWPIWHTATSERRWYRTKFDVLSPANLFGYDTKWLDIFNNLDFSDDCHPSQPMRTRILRRTSIEMLVAFTGAGRDLHKPNIAVPDLTGEAATSSAPWLRLWLEHGWLSW